MHQCIEILDFSTWSGMPVLSVISQKSYGSTRTKCILQFKQCLLILCRYQHLSKLRVSDHFNVWILWAYLTHWLLNSNSQYINAGVAGTQFLNHKLWNSYLSGCPRCVVGRLVPWSKRRAAVLQHFLQWLSWWREAHCGQGRAKAITGYKDWFQHVAART